MMQKSYLLIIGAEDSKPIYVAKVVKRNFPILTAKLCA
ncbi:hypothetical protein BMWSH_1977 [Priestia megaterium WSH-002]|uniref:Uncharacterized protein n=1 Tax=Priestia megaterium (strain WSH-002) TaxID=1006007 RepID=A0A8D3X0J2_PRIMW|nr:hypothetical protein BMWSH_1977 [Priestia megaterium WSH-002]